jgi:hypothetical protein
MNMMPNETTAERTYHQEIKICRIVKARLQREKPCRLLRLLKNLLFREYQVEIARRAARFLHDLKCQRRVRDFIVDGVHLAESALAKFPQNLEIR